PTNSGISPYLMRSSGSTSPKSSLMCSPPSGARTSATKPMPLLRERFRMILSRPENAPPQMNRILDVSTCKNSCCGCLRPPCGGTDAMVPSMILSSACCTPSPETSRVIEGLSDLRHSQRRHRQDEPPGPITAQGCDRQAAGAKACRKAGAPQDSKDLALKESAREHLRPA